MSTFFENDKNKQEPLMDFADAMFADREPATITQAGMDDYNSQLRLKFDGSKLSLLKGDDEIDWWPAISGKENYWDKKYQTLKDTGPLPEGNYDVKLSNFQDRLAEPLYKRALSYFPFGKLTKYPGGEVKWGNSRISLVPASDTQTYGRGGFFIHGGNKHASAGCIDTARYNDDFMETFLALDRDLPLEVSYPEKMRNFTEIKAQSNKEESPEGLLGIIARKLGQD